MVSKASDDLPEPDSPVNTTRRSRGISRSTFLRLCSRAPRIVIARMAEPALCWRFALITSSISGDSRRVDRAALGRVSPEQPGSDAKGCARNIGRTRTDFQCSVQAINGLLRLGVAMDLVAIAPTKRPARGRAFFSLKRFRSDGHQYFVLTGPPQRELMRAVTISPS